jgi:hypothetical protein
MKKLLFSIAVLLASTVAANAQISEGHVMVGGNIANASIGFDDGQESAFKLTPKAAWFINDGIALGGYASFGVSHIKGNEGSLYTYGIGALGRYYVTDDNINVLKKTKFFGEATVGFEGNDDTVTDSNTNGLGFSAGPGIAYFLTPNIGLEALLKYNGIVGFGSETYTNNFTLEVGFQIYLPSKKLVNTVKQDFR